MKIFVEILLYSNFTRILVGETQDSCIIISKWLIHKSYYDYQSIGQNENFLNLKNYKSKNVIPIFFSLISGCTSIKM